MNKLKEIGKWIRDGNAIEFAFLVVLILMVFL